jgi:hypothetical protein
VVPRGNRAAPAHKRLVRVSLRAAHLVHEVEVFQLVKLNTHKTRHSERSASQIQRWEEKRRLSQLALAGLVSSAI